MLDQLINLAKEHLTGVSRQIPELNDLGAKQVSDITSSTIINLIMQQARKGNVGSMREMLSGHHTADDHSTVIGMKDTVANQLQSKLNISDTSAMQLATMALPIIMNMLNSKVQTAQSDGFNVHDSLNTISANGGGFLNSISNIFGAKSQNTKMINSIFQNLIS